MRHHAVAKLRFGLCCRWWRGLIIQIMGAPAVVLSLHLQPTVSRCRFLVPEIDTQPPPPPAARQSRVYCAACAALVVWRLRGAQVYNRQHCVLDVPIRPALRYVFFNWPGSAATTACGATTMQAAATTDTCPIAIRPSKRTHVHVHAAWQSHRYTTHAHGFYFSSFAFGFFLDAFAFLSICRLPRRAKPYSCLRPAAFASAAAKAGAARPTLMTDAWFGVCPPFATTLPASTRPPPLYLDSHLDHRHLSTFCLDTCGGGGSLFADLIHSDLVSGETRIETRRRFLTPGFSFMVAVTAIARAFSLYSSKLAPSGSRCVNIFTPRRRRWSQAVSTVDHAHHGQRAAPASSIQSSSPVVMLIWLGGMTGRRAGSGADSCEKRWLAEVDRSRLRSRHCSLHPIWPPERLTNDLTCPNPHL